MAQHADAKAERKKALIDFDPSQFLLSTESADRIMDTYVEKNNLQNQYDCLKERCLSIGISFLVSIFCSFDTFLTWPAAGDLKAIIFYLARACALAIIVFWLISCIFNVMRLKKQTNTQMGDIRAEMKTSAKKDINYTAIMIIALRENGNDDRLFVEKHDQSDHAYFLPWCTMNRDDSIQYQDERIKSHLYNRYKELRPGDIADVIPLSERPVFTIKASSGDVQKQHAFVFFHISFVPEVRHIFDKYADTDGGWYTIRALKGNPQAVERNSDIIKILDQYPEYVKDSFTGEQRPPLKIIWNITKDCGYNCQICATHDENRNEFALEQKLRMLQSILTYKNRIGLIDFAGGDPCFSDESLLIIKEAIHALGDDHVSVTTTGSGIHRLDPKTRRTLLKHCEITIDIEHPRRHAGLSREESHYVETNIDQMVTYGDDVHELTINMPVIHPDLDEKEIGDIVNEVLKIKNANKNIKISVSFLRLMPVGKASENEYPPGQTPWDVISQIQNRLTAEGIECTKHCSLRVCEGTHPGKGCGRLKTKLGVDCEGNVFACAWAGYLPGLDRISDNPFYIGNLLESDLLDLLSEFGNQNPHYKKMTKYSPEKFEYCPLVSYVKCKDPNKKADPLSKKTGQVNI